MTDTAVVDLEKRVSALEANKQYAADKDAVQQVQYEMLKKLRSIREELANSESNSASTKELEALRKENEDLKKQLSKSEYRIMHLVKNLEAAENNM